MSASSRTRALAGLAVGLTVTALFAATITVPAAADPIDASSKFKAGDSIAASRVIKDRYLVQTIGTPAVRGGSRATNNARQDAVTTAAKAAGARVEHSFGALWTGVSVQATPDQIRRIAKSPSVQAIYPVLRVALPKTTKSATEVSSALDAISAAGLSQDGSGVKVGVIDSGIDFNNSDLGGSGVPNGDTFPTARVTVGHDFVGDDYNPDDPESTPVEDNIPDDCNGHGTHVAGIIGADGTGDGASTTGVAPKVSLGAYRIFGCEGSTSTELILRAMTQAQADGMDVVNMSLGSDFDSWPDYPDAVAASSLVNSGVVMVIAAGNAGQAGLFAAGSPAVGKGVISVASYEAERVRVAAIGVGSNKIAYSQVYGTATAPADNVKTLDLRIASSLTACKTLKKVAAGTALLIKRGTCSTTTKVSKAKSAGAAAVVIYDTASGLVDYETDGTTFSIPAVSISGAQGTNLNKAVSASATKSVKMIWLKVQSDVVNPNGGTISTFSSAGLAADLSLVPTISAPGAKIYSTLPIEQGGHGNESGTSMATPFVAGSVALLLQARPGLKGQPKSVAQVLYNTAAPVVKATESGVTKHPEAVFRQGAGLIKVQNAINAGVSASPSVLHLGEGDKHTVTVTLTNKTAGTLTYVPRRVSGVSAAASTGSATSVGTSTPNYAFGDVGFTAVTKSVTIAPGHSAPLVITLKAPSKALKGKAGMLYGGWVQFTTTGSANSVSVPFVGMRGDYQKVKLLNKAKYVLGSKKYSMPALGFSDTYGNVDFVASQKSNKYEFDMDSYFPSVIYHLDYPASDLRLKVINTKTKKSYYALIDYSASSIQAATHWNHLSRDDSGRSVTFWGQVLNGSSSLVVPDGNYQLQLKVLKPRGDSAKSSDWELYTSPKFYINQ